MPLELETNELADAKLLPVLSDNSIKECISLDCKEAMRQLEKNIDDKEREIRDLRQQLAESEAKVAPFTFSQISDSDEKVCTVHCTSLHCVIQYFACVHWSIHGIFFNLILLVVTML